jgi:hypothetical protein
MGKDCEGSGTGLIEVLSQHEPGGQEIIEMKKKVSWTGEKGEIKCEGRKKKEN